MDRLVSKKKDSAYSSIENIVLNKEYGEDTIFYQYDVIEERNF
jgi:hypothetical protein